MFLSDLSIKRPVFATMLVAVLMVFGAVTYGGIGVDLMPNIEAPIVTVVTALPGADPETVESDVTETLEEVLGEISGLEKLRSVSAQGVSQIIVEFAMDADQERAIQDVRDRIGRVVSVLPQGSFPPQIARFDLGAMPILTLAVSGPDDIGELTRFATRHIADPLRTLKGVGSIETVGGRERVVDVQIDPVSLEASGLSVGDVIDALGNQNVEAPSGSVEGEGRRLVVRVLGRLETLDDLRELPIGAAGGRAVHLGDVAEVKEGFEDARSAARVNGRAAIVLVVRKQAGENALATADAIRSCLAELSSGFPAGYRVDIAADTTGFTRDSFEAVRFDMILGAVLVTLVVFLFLRSLRSTLIAALAIPTSVLGTVGFIGVLGFSFNTMTMLALTLSIGILIDDAIVVLENIFRHRQMGKSARDAALLGAREIGPAVVATTLTLAAVFLPTALTDGLFGLFLYEFGMTVVIAVLISLFVSFTLTPLLCSRWLTKSDGGVRLALFDRALVGLESVYRRVIVWALCHRGATVGIALFVFAAAIFSFGAISSEFEPAMDQGQFSVNLRLPEGTPLNRTAMRADQVASTIKEMVPEVVGTVATVGADPQQTQSLAQVFVKLGAKDERRRTQAEIMSFLRSRLVDIHDAKVSVEEYDFSSGSSGMRQAMIQLDLRGAELPELERVSKEVAAQLADIEGLVDVDTTFARGQPELQIRVAHRQAAELGISAAAVATTTRGLIDGVEVGRFGRGEKERPIRVRLEEERRREIERFATLKIRSPVSGQLVELGSIADLVQGKGPVQIDRQARMRQVTVLANLAPSLALGDAVKKIDEVVARVLPPHITASYGGQIELQKESFSAMLVTLGLAVMLVYMVLASQFESLVHPLTIMLSLPLSVIGAVLALMLSGQNMSIFALIGVVMLMGLVTKNAILLVDCAGQLRTLEGLSPAEAMRRAGPIRLRPILMTAVSTAFGMLPVALSSGWGAEMRVPMATTAIGGLVVSTLLTLIVIPVVYCQLSALADRLARLFRRSPSVQAEAAQEVTV